jgi:hypothetical protein
MPTRKIDDALWEKAICHDRDHDPPSHMVWPPGTYEHVCSSCGRTVRFVVGSIRMDASELAKSVQGCVQKAWDPPSWGSPGPGGDEREHE